MHNALTVQEPSTEDHVFNLVPKSLQEAMQLSELISKSRFIPKEYQGQPADVLVVVQFGHELGLKPLQALQSIACINGRPAVFGDAMIGLVQRSPNYEWHDESGSTPNKGVCIVKRKNLEPHKVEFSLDDAKRAGLLGKAGPWTQYTSRMLVLRARAFALRDVFADVLKGLSIAEEAMDITPAGPATTEAPKPTLKERLKEKLDVVLVPQDTPSTEPEQGQPEELAGPAEELSQYEHELKHCARTNQAINDVWRQVPEHLKQDLYACYSAQLKGLKKA